MAAKLYFFLPLESLPLDSRTVVEALDFPDFSVTYRPDTALR
jgi:hypothetical protein